MILTPKLVRRVPGQIAALLLATAAVALFASAGRDHRHAVRRHPQRAASFQVPEFRADLIVPLLPAALTVAILAAVESLLSAVVADSMSGDRHNSNAELMAQGVANVAVPLSAGFR